MAAGVALLALTLTYLPIGSFLHEVGEHDALEISHCVCLVCHISVHSPANAGADALSLTDDDAISRLTAQETLNAAAWRLDASVPGRSPPLG